MPRIEIKTDEFDDGCNDFDEGTNPTLDVCRRCALGFEIDEAVTADIVNDLSENGIAIGDAVVVTTDVEHPPYEAEEDFCDCDVCGSLLTARDN